MCLGMQLPTLPLSAVWRRCDGIACAHSAKRKHRQAQRTQHSPRVLKENVGVTRITCQPGPPVHAAELVTSLAASGHPCGVVADWSPPSARSACSCALSLTCPASAGEAAPAENGQKNKKKKKQPQQPVESAPNGTAAEAALLNPADGAQVELCPCVCALASCSACLQS